MSLFDGNGYNLSVGSGKWVIVTDYDRTLTDENLQLYEPVLESLTRLRRDYGIKVIIASGRKLGFLLEALDKFHLVDAIVGENGAILHFPQLASTINLGDGTKIKAALRASSVPIDEGEVVVSAKRAYEEDVKKIIKERRLRVEIQYNRDDLMLLPSGLNKAAGVKEVLSRLGLSDAKLICIGDAENDIPLFEIANIRVATANALPAVKNKADAVCMGVGGVGVAHFLDYLTSKLSHASS